MCVRAEILLIVSRLIGEHNTLRFLVEDCGIGEISDFPNVDPIAENYTFLPFNPVKRIVSNETTRFRVGGCPSVFG